jgi:hypothetical protein
MSTPSPPPGYLDPSILTNAIHDDWKDLVNPQDSLVNQFLSIGKRCVALPDADMQWPLIAAFVMSNPKWCQCLPALFLYGKEGSGKSQLGTLIAEFRESEIFNAKSSPTSVRNSLHERKYIPDTEESQEQDGAMLFIDNVYINTFLNPSQDLLTQIFLGGYKKKTDTVSIAIPGAGGNKRFRTFANRVISSVDPIHASYELRELARRLVLVKLQKLEDIKDCDFNLETALNVEKINFEGFFDSYWEFWNKPSTINDLIISHKSIARRPSKFPSDRWEQFKDLIATGLTCGLWKEKGEAIDYCLSYLEWMSNFLSEKTQLEQFLDSWINGIALVSQSSITSKIAEWKESGAIYQKPRQRELDSAMLKLGYKLDRDVWIKES